MPVQQGSWWKNSLAVSSSKQIRNPNIKVRNKSYSAKSKTPNANDASLEFSYLDHLRLLRVPCFEFYSDSFCAPRFTIANLCRAKRALLPDRQEGNIRLRLGESL